MKRESSILVGATLGIVGVLIGGFLAFYAIASSTAPGQELGLVGAALGIGCGLVCAAIGVGANFLSRSRGQHGDGVRA